MFISKPFVSIQLLGKRGAYPKFGVETRDHLFVSEPGAIWTAVVQRPLPDDWEGAEVCSLAPEEIRLLAAILLSEADPFERGFIGPELWHRGSVEIRGSEPDLRSEQFRRVLQARVEEIRREACSSVRYCGCQPDGDYARGDKGSQRDAGALLENIDMDDRLLLAGLGRMLSSSRLRCAANFHEESFVQACLSLGAAMEFIRLHLEHEKGETQGFPEALRYVRETFPLGDQMTDFLEWMYELRVMAIHPASRFGEAWVPPVMAGMLYELQKFLVPIYRHIVLGDVPEPD